jgi:hypothetical protein
MHREQDSTPGRVGQSGKYGLIRVKALLRIASRQIRLSTFNYIQPKC